MRGRERSVFELIEQAELLFEQERAEHRLLACCTSPSSASCGTLCLSGLFSSDQRVPLIQRPALVWQRSWAFPDRVAALAEHDGVRTL
ncbi:MAG: hypothetical protein LC790_05465 [Actinobacteria bacterium]|nr:hypothetical protein [Actinomycetota bacterium]